MSCVLFGSFGSLGLLVFGSFGFCGLSVYVCISSQKG